MTKWTSRAFNKQAPAVTIDEALLDEQIVILLNGKNIFNDVIYSYVQLSLRSLQKLKPLLDKNENFNPSDFGTVVAAGRDAPTEEVQQEMAETYGTYYNAPTPAKVPLPSIQPKVWDDEEEETESEETGTLAQGNDPSPSIS